MTSSSESSESDYKKRLEKIDKFIFPLPPTRNVPIDESTERIPLLSNLLEIITKENTHIFLSNIKIELIKKDDNTNNNNNEKNESIDMSILNNDMKKKLRNELLLQIKNIKKIILYQNYLLVVINDEKTFPNNINYIYENNEYCVQFQNVKEYKYNNIIEAGKFTTNILEIIFRNILLKNEHLVKFNQKYLVDYLKRNDKNAYKGFYISSQITSNGLFMLVNSKDKIIGKHVYTKINDIQKKYYEINEQKEKITEFFQNHKYIIATYGDHKIYKISKVNFDKNPENTSINIKNENGLIVSINLKDYYNNYYKIEIRDKTQFLFEIEQTIKKPKYNNNSNNNNNTINTNNNNNEEEEQKQIIYLIPELFRILGPDDYDKTYSSNKNFITPNQKIYRIKDIYQYMNSTKYKMSKSRNNKSILKSPKEINEEWGINLGKFYEFKARLIKQPTLLFSGDYNIEANQGRFRSYDPLVKKDITKENIFYLYFENIKENKDIVNLNQLAEYDKIILKNNANWEETEKELRSKEISDKKELGIIILTENTKNKYPQLKKYFINNYPKIVTQIIKLENIKFKNANKK